MLNPNDNSGTRNPPPPTIAQPVRMNSSEQAGLNKNYLFSLNGLLRLGLILFQFAGWISAAAVPKYFNGQTYMPPEISSSRDAYLFFSIVGFLFAIFLFIIHLFNLINVKPLNGLPVNLFILATDIIWVIPTFVLAIVCAVREGSVKDPFNQYAIFVNVGAFASASTFAFLCSFLYAIDAGFYLMKQMRAGK